VNTEIAIDAIRRDGGTQMRASIDQDVVNDFAERMDDGDRFPPIVVFSDGGAFWLADGFHRMAARERLARKYEGTELHAGWTNVNVEKIDGTQHDAIKYAICANQSHGLRRTNADKQKAVRAALAHPAMMNMSNRDIAKAVGVGHQLVGKVRDEIKVDDSSSRPQLSTTAQQPTSAYSQIDSINGTESKPHKAVDTATDRRVRAAATARPATADEQKKKALELAANGVGWEAIAGVIGRDESTIRRWAANPDTPAKENAAHTGRKKDLDEGKIASLYEDGKTTAEIAVAMGASPEKILRYLKDLGLSKAGKRKAAPLAVHISRAESEAFAWEVALDNIAATASVANPDHVKELSHALGRLELATRKLKVRLNKEVGKGE
jgi:transposase